MPFFGYIDLIMIKRKNNFLSTHESCQKTGALCLIPVSFIIKTLDLLLEVLS